MKTSKVNAALTGLLAALFYNNTHAALVLNPPLPVTEVVTVQLIQTDDEAGTFATLFGDASQQAEIFGLIDDIWAQAGIDVNFLPMVTSYSDSFAFSGTPGMNAPRPSGDLFTLEANGVTDGVANVNPFVLDMYMVNIVPGSGLQSSNTTNGIAFRPGKTSAVFVGSSLPNSLSGREVIAAVVAHEIGHNLGLPHEDLDMDVLIDNLMWSNGNTGTGERLVASQIAAALASPFSVPIPIPTAVWLFGSGIVVLFGVRRRPGG